MLTSYCYACKKNCQALPEDNDLPVEFEPPSKTQQKAMLKDLRASKKLKYQNNPVAAKEACMTEEKDRWATKQGKKTSTSKAQMKKATLDEKKLAKKQEKL